jgi:hypothetical protein
MIFGAEGATQKCQKTQALPHGRKRNAPQSGPGPRFIVARKHFANAKAILFDLDATLSAIRLYIEQCKNQRGDVRKDDALREIDDIIPSVTQYDCSVLVS